MKETQESVYQWTKDTFPRHVGVHGRAVALVEEAVELALAAGLTAEDIYDTVRIPIQKAVSDIIERKPQESDRGEIADVLICVYAYAAEAGFDSQEALDDKMAVNRSRSKEYYDAKTQKKHDMGLPLKC